MLLSYLKLSLRLLARNPFFTFINVAGLSVGFAVFYIFIGSELLARSNQQYIVAIVIAMPAAYYLADQYLMHYVERMNLHWWHFIMPVAILVLIMFSTIASVLWKAAKCNPVEALKYE